MAGLSGYAVYGAIAVATVAVMMLAGFLVMRIRGRARLTDKSDVYHAGLDGGKALGRSREAVSTGKMDAAATHYRDWLTHRANFRESIEGPYRGQGLACTRVFDTGVEVGLARVGAI